MNPASKRQHHTDGRISHFLGTIVGHISHRNAELASHIAINVVTPDAATNNQLAIVEPLKNPARKLQIVIQHDRAGVFDLSDQVTFAIGVQRDDVRQIAEYLLFRRQIARDKIGDNNFMLAV